jgi:primosomal protein N'
MSFAPPNWQELGSLNGDALKSELFRVFQNASLEIQTGDGDDPELLSTVPRMAELLERRPELASFTEILSALARATGLWNYIDKADADARDSLVAEIATIKELNDITLHREQIAALNILLSGKNLILSAPTSFGKSLLIDAMLLSGKYRRVAIVLPTIALLDEFRRRLLTRFGERFDIIMHHSEASDRENVIFLGTQERILLRDDLKNLDLVVVDEFYKLDPNRKDERAITLNAAVYKLLRRAKQFFFLGPNIETVIVDGDLNF